jgi:penicillin-binding protein 1
MLTGHSSGEDLIMKANEKYLVNSQEQPERGKIYDRNGKVLAEDVERYKVVACSRVKKPVKVAINLNT